MTSTRSTILVLAMVACLVTVCGADEPSAKKARLHGRFTAADTGKPIAGATLRVFTGDVAGKPAIAEAVSDAGGVYALELPLGHCDLWGVLAPPGYYTQDPTACGTILTTSAEPTVTRDFVLLSGSPWRVELAGVKLPLDQPAMYSALPYASGLSTVRGEIIYAFSRLDGKGVLTIPSGAPRYYFNCYLPASASSYDLPGARLELDAGFDPCQVKGVPVRVAERNAVRLLDAAGRSALVENVEVAVDAGQAVLRFHAKQAKAASGLTLRGKAEDEAGKPLAGVKFAAVFTNRRTARKSHLEATTDAQGCFEILEVRLADSYFESPGHVHMVARKPGFDGADTVELDLLELKKSRSGDFGTVTLRPGRTLRGKIVDENGSPVSGAVISNLTNTFLYGHLRCRTDEKGNFVMPDLAFGRQTLSARYGDKIGHVEYMFNSLGDECVITVGPVPAQGIRAPKVPRRPQAVQPVKPPMPIAPPPPPVDDGSWDLTPPKKEPKYEKSPRYALLVFGAKREARIWMVLDGTTLYVDRNGNGDLTETDERLANAAKKEIGNPGLCTHLDEFEFTVQPVDLAASKFKFWHWVRDEKFVPTTDFDKMIHAEWVKLRHENGSLYRQGGSGQGQTPLIFMPKPADAQVCALDGPLTFVVKSPEHQVLKRGEGGDVAFHIAVMGRPYRGSERPLYNCLDVKEVARGAHLELEIEYPAKAADAPPVKRKHLLTDRC